MHYMLIVLIYEFRKTSKKLTALNVNSQKTGAAVIFYTNST